jgi:hypothetical protein
MKFFIVMWLCIQSPTVPLDKTCVTQVIKTSGYNTMQECRYDAVMFANKVMVVPDIYVTTFCTEKEVTTI